MSSCTGACCATFWLRKSAQEKLRNREGHGDAAWHVLDGDMIAAMVVRLGWIRATFRNWRLGYGFQPRRWWKMRGELFTCRFWDTKTRLCRVYPNRPKMCRAYAVDGPTTCQHGCGMECGQ